MSSSSWPRVLLVSPDQAFLRRATQALRGAGFEVEEAGDAEEALKRLSRAGFDLLVLELDMPRKDGRWLIRRIRDEYVGRPPRIVALVAPDADSQAVAGLGADGLLLSPVTDEMLLASAVGLRQNQRNIAADVLRELGRLSILSADPSAGLRELAVQMSRLFRADNCLVAGMLGESMLRASAQAVEPDRRARVELLAELSAKAGAPLLVGGGAELPQTLLSIPLQTAQGTEVGCIILCDARHQLVPRQVIDWLRDLGRRLSVELSWLSVHQRIAMDRDRLRERAMYDPMLGILTRTTFEQQLPIDISALEQRQEPTTLAVFDVRGMREVNDRFGHRAGDRLLKHVSSQLSRDLRRGDLLARYSGDRFAVALLGTPVEKAVAVVERLQAAVATPLQHREHEIVPRLYAGISPVTGGAEQAVASLGRAAAAVARGKQSGKALAISESSDASREVSESEGLAAGTNLGGMYQVVHEISRGAMGVVYRAEDLGLGRMVALKTLRPDLARDEELIAMFRREAATLAKLRHDNLVQVHAFGMDQEHLFFVMELIEGQSLDDRMDQVAFTDSFMPLAEVRGFLPQIASALDTLHDAHILHRDVKPANIIHDRRRQRAVLVDFGIATGEELGTPAGTPGYAAPEVFRGERQGPATDVYGLAATVYAVLVNELPFDTGSTGNLMSVLRMQVQGPPPPVRLSRPGFPPEVDEVLARALLPDASKRYARAGAFAEAILEALDKVPEDVAAASRSSIEAAVQARSGRTTWRRADGAAAEPEPQSFEGPCTRGVLFRAAHQLVVPDMKDGGKREVPVINSRAATLLGSGWLQLLANRDDRLAGPLGAAGSRFGWYSTDAFIGLLEAAGNNGHDANEFARLLGKNAAASSFVGFYGADPARYPVDEILAAAATFWHRYHTWGDVRLERDRDACVLKITGGPAHELLCSSTFGLLEHIAGVSASAGAEITHSRCSATGAPSCEFRVVGKGRRRVTALRTS